LSSYEHSSLPPWVRAMTRGKNRSAGPHVAKLAQLIHLSRRDGDRSSIEYQYVLQDSVSGAEKSPISCNIRKREGFSARADSFQDHEEASGSFASSFQIGTYSYSFGCRCLPPDDSSRTFFGSTSVTHAAYLGKASVLSCAGLQCPDKMEAFEPDRSASSVDWSRCGLKTAIFPIHW